MESPTGWAGLLPDLERVVREAGDIIRTNWDKPSDIKRKGRIDLVTDTDLAVEEKLLESLSRLLPESTILAEESSSDQSLGKLTWVVDPLDGTTNFAHRLPAVAISVGLWDTDGVKAAMVYNPIWDECFSAARGHGVHFNGRPVTVSGTSRLEESVIATGFPYSVRDHAEQIASWLASVLSATQGVRRFGAAALDLAYLACGRFDGFYEILLKPWDMAAGSLLVEEAGGMVTPFTEEGGFHLRSPSILATNGHIHEGLRRLLV